MITRAGGLKDQGQDTWVVLERHGHRAAVPFGALIYEPGNNIWAWPGDTIYLYKEPQTFLAFGASGQQGQFQFTAGAAVVRLADDACRGGCGGRWAARPPGRSWFGVPLSARAARTRREAWGRLLEDGRPDRADRLFGEL